MGDNKAFFFGLVQKQSDFLAAKNTIWPFGSPWICFFPPFFFLPWQLLRAHPLPHLLRLHPGLLFSLLFPGHPWSSADHPLCPEAVDNLEQITKITHTHTHTKKPYTSTQDIKISRHTWTQNLPGGTGRSDKLTGRPALWALMASWYCC